jgi:uncharacterized caspase-like protein
MYILAAGVSRYDDINIRLGSPAADAEAVAGALERHAAELYDSVYVRVLTDGQATAVGIESALERITGAAEVQDTVILFLAGHGDIAEDGEYYFLPADADITDLITTAVSVGRINAFVEKLSASKVGIFLDTCKSGSATKTIGTVAMSRGLREVRIITTLAKSRGIAVFSAANETQDAYEIPDLGHGIFTAGLLDALAGYRNEDGLINITGVLGEVAKSTRQTARKYLGIEQSPIMYVFGEDFILGK